MTIAAVWKQLDALRGSTKPKPASAAAIAKLGPIPKELAASLAVHDGGVHLDSYDILAAKDVARWTKNAREFGADLVAVAADSAGNLYALDKRGRLIGVERQGPTGTFVKAKSLEAWLASLVKRAKKGELVAEGSGLVEATVEPAVGGSSDEFQRVEDPLAEQVMSMITNGDVAKLDKLLASKKLTPTAVLWTGSTLMLEAAEARQLGVVELLVKRGCPVDHGAAWGARTALFGACWGMADGAALVKWLLSKKANPNAPTNYDGPPLASAIMWDHGDLAGLLIKAGADESALKAGDRKKLRKLL